MQVLVYLEPERHRRMKYAAVDLDKSVSEIVRELVEEFLAKHEKKRGGRR
jgi:predicted DNA-binding protein